MRIGRFDAAVGRPVDAFDSEFRLSPIALLGEGIRTFAFHLGLGGRIGRHAIPRGQLLCVTAGTGWVVGADGDPVRVSAGYAAYWEPGEEHEAWTDFDELTAIVLEGELTLWFRPVMGPPIVVADYDPAWRERFEAIRADLEVAFAGGAAIEHVGSTAVPGLPARDVVDVDVIVPTERDLAWAIEVLSALGYQHRGDLGVPGREAFSAPPGTPVHDLAVVVRGSAVHLDRIGFRDHLRANPADAAAYGERKRAAAAEAGGDVERYEAALRQAIDDLRPCAT